MLGARDKCKVATLVASTVLVGLVGLHSLIKPVFNGCIMSYMYPTYIPISTPKSVSPGKYGLYLYYEGWKKIDFNERLKKLNGVPVLFIPGNAGSYKQVPCSFSFSIRHQESFSLSCYLIFNAFLVVALLELY